MLEKNYTNPEDRGRFGFSMSGEYRSPYKAEPLIVGLLVGGGAAVGLILFFLLSGFVTKLRGEADEATDFVMLAFAVAMVVLAVVIVAVVGVGVRSVKKGFKCSYTANDETFTATVGGDLHVIRYSEVTSVEFSPRSSMGKIRGYDVTVRMGSREQEFSICSDGYLSPQSTPFYIIQERLDLRRQRTTAEINTSRADSRAITRAEVDRAKTGTIGAMDRMAQLLGETSNMPELSIDATPAQRAVAEMDKLLSSTADQMPAIGQKPAPAMPQSYIGEDGRDHNIRDVQAQGTFYIKASVGKMISSLVTITAVWALLCFGLEMLANFLISRGGIYSLDILSGLLGIFCPIEPFVILFSIFRIRGPMCRYKADGRGFFVTMKGKGDDIILYRDVLSVDYKPTKLLWKINGFKVDILTRSGLIHYDYIFPKISHKIPRQNLPFEVIRKNMPERDNK